MTKEYPKSSNEQISDNFNITEFKCPCSRCTIILVDPELVEKLEGVRGKIGGPLKINSGYRCGDYQAELRARGYETSIGPSQHELGRAADIMSDTEGYSGLFLEKIARGSGFMAVGVADFWAHVDLRADKVRRWEYKR